MSIRVGATARVLAGVSITINCKAVGLPYPNIFWNLRGKPLKTQGHVTVDDSKLVILNAGSEDSGMYGCVALSAMGNDTAETRLTIHSKIQTSEHFCRFLDFKEFMNLPPRIPATLSAIPCAKGIATFQDGARN